jgi:hypothetical protein
MDRERDRRRARRMEERDRDRHGGSNGWADKKATEGGI